MKTSEKEDHRVRVAKMRRERMTARLLQATMECYAEHLSSGPPSVDEVIARAEVARGTFYKYFDSVEEAITRRAEELVDEMVDSLKDLVAGQTQPIKIFTISVHLFLMRSVIDRTWAAFVAHSDMLRPGGELFNGITRHLSQAAGMGQVHFANPAAARTVAVGAMRGAIQSNAKGDEADRSYLDEVATLILIGLGVDRKEAEGLVAEATIFIRGAGPDRLTWWRDPWTQPA
jgi:AcrR family transcriptional regulator